MYTFTYYRTYNKISFSLIHQIKKSFTIVQFFESLVQYKNG